MKQNSCQKQKKLVTLNNKTNKNGKESSRN